MIWLIGCKGMLGTQIKGELEKAKLDFISTDKDVDITEQSVLDSFAADKEISWVINASAYTAVDKAETEEELAERINGLGAGNIAKTASEIGAKLIYFSTDYVYDGEKPDPYVEDDETNPVGAYGRTKLSGELQIKQNADKYFIFRISWLYGVHGNNFVKTMLRLFNEREEISVVNDQIGAPTYCGTLAQNLIEFIQTESEEYGVYQYSDEGDISWYDFACEIYNIALKREIAPKVKLKSIPSSEFPALTKRPAFSHMDKAKVKRLGFNVVGWKENLNKYFDEMRDI